MKNVLSHQRHGFTLIELLVVISIIGLLASVVLVTTSNTKKKAQDSKIKAEVSEVQTAMELYASDNDGGYPNPTPGTRSAWCVGGTYCKLSSASGTEIEVEQQLSGLSIDNFTLPKVITDTLTQQGIIYTTCGLSTATCPAAELSDALVFSPNASQLVFATHEHGFRSRLVGRWNDSEVIDEDNFDDDIESGCTGCGSGGNETVTTDISISYQGTSYGNGVSNTTLTTAQIPQGATFNVNWTSAGATTCIHSADMNMLAGIVHLPLNGNGLGTYTGKKHYQIDCSGPGGAMSDYIDLATP